MTAAVTLVSIWVKRSTVLGVAHLDDGDKFRKDMLGRLTRVEGEVNSLKRRESTFIHLFAAIGGELRVLNGHMAIHQIELDAETLDRDALRQQAALMRGTLQRMTDIIEIEANELMEEVASRRGHGIGASEAPPAVAPSAVSARYELGEGG